MFRIEIGLAFAVYLGKKDVSMSQMLFFMLIIFVSTFALSAEKQNRIKCSMMGPEDKVYYFDTQSQRYRLSVLEKGRPKTSLSRHIRQQINPVQETRKVSYSFHIDDRTEVSVDMDTATNRGSGEIKLRAKGHTKKFDGCEFIAAANDISI